MQNIDIKNFTTVSSVENYDHVVLSLFGGSSAKMTVSLLRDILVRGISPSIGEDGTWYVGESATGVTAEGKTPEFRKGLVGIEYKYTSESETMWRLLVSYADLRLRYEDLTAEQVASLKLTFNDLTEEDIAILQQPATEMIAKLEETDKNIQEAESLRVEAEDSRVFAETSRVDAEKVRVESEGLREESEKKRVDNELLRVSSEGLRQEAESNRVSAETDRVKADNSREAAESERVKAENVRANAESGRINSENNRVKAESARVNSEIQRKDAENARLSAENARVDAEFERVEAESARIEAEQSRVSEHNNLKAESEAATSDARQAAAEARNVPEIRNGNWWVYNLAQASYVDTGLTALGKSPIIINGTWWIWDDSTDSYEDTGQSVNTDYQLTKEKIEGVFQGNIDTHWHDRYVDKVEGMGLSEANFTKAEKVYLATLYNYDDTALKNRVEEVADAIPTQVSQLENDSQYITATELANKKYATEDSLNTEVEVLQQEVATKQTKNIYFTDVVASNWIREDVYRDYPFRADLSLEGVTAGDYAEVVFGMDDSITGNYAPLCETKEGIVSIWSTVDKAIIVPTVIINKG